MSEDKPKPVDDLKEGLGLLFRAAKGAVQSLPTDKVETVAKDAAKEVGRAFESLGSEIEKVMGRSPSQPAAPPDEPAAAAEPPPDDKKYDDGYAPSPPPKGPRVG